MYYGSHISNLSKSFLNTFSTLSSKCLTFRQNTNCFTETIWYSTRLNPSLSNLVFITTLKTLKPVHIAVLCLTRGTFRASFNHRLYTEAVDHHSTFSQLSISYLQPCTSKHSRKFEKRIATQIFYDTSLFYI